MQIVLNNFRLEDAGDLTRAVCSVDSPGFPETFWFETPRDLAGAIDIAEPNWAAVALLYPAMFLGRSLVIEAPISPKLLFALRGDLQALLMTYDPRLQRIDVVAEPPEAGERPRGTRVATGFSAGVDSFATFYLYTGSDVPAGFRLTDLTIFNVWGHDAGAARDLYRHVRERCASYAAENGMGSLFAASNLDDFYGGAGVEPSYQKTHTLRNAATALVFEKEVAEYLYSSTYPYNNIHTTPSIDMSYLDPLLLPLLCTERMSFRSAGAGLSRAEKTAMLIGRKDPQAMLEVCVAPPETRLPPNPSNCSKCWKCARTMITLDALGGLDAFASVFDLTYYRANRAHLLLQMAARAENGDYIALEALNLARSSGLPMPSPASRIASQTRRLRRRARGWAKRFLRQA